MAARFARSRVNSVARASGCACRSWARARGSARWKTRPPPLLLVPTSSCVRGQMSKAPHSKRDSNQGYVTALLVLVASIGLGLFGLPRLGHRAAHSDSPLIGRPAPDF